MLARLSPLRFLCFCIAASALFCARTAQAALVFGDSSTGGTSSRNAGDSPISSLTVGQNTPINQIGVLVDLNSDGDLKFVINDATSNSFVLITAAQAVTDDGDTFKLSSTFSPVTLLAGHHYYIGAIADVSGNWNYDPFPMAITQNGITNQITDNDVTNFNSPGLTGPGTAQIPIELFNAAPTPGDFNLDHHVDARDIAALQLALTNLSLYESTYGVTDADLAQINQLPGESSTTLNNSDLQALINLLQSGGGSFTAGSSNGDSFNIGSLNSVPEPSSLALAYLATLTGIFILIPRNRHASI
jgi:hypothetical protein